MHVTQFENGQRCNQIQNLNSNITLQDESLNLLIQVDTSNEEDHAHILEHSKTRVITFILFIYLYILISPLFIMIWSIYVTLKLYLQDHISFFHENMKLDQHIDH